MNGLKKSGVFKFISGWIVLSLIVSGVMPSQAFAQSVLGLPEPGTMVQTSASFMPVMMKGLKVHPDNPLLFDFILDSGKSGLAIDSQDFKAESQKLIKYFLASLTIKEDDLWVNLSPYEKDRMITEELGKTELGRDMLAQDYILKQLTASLIYPEKDLGKAFWDRVYTKAQVMFGTTDIPIDTFNKVWITADKAKVLERNNAAYVVGSHLKVMLESDYVAQQEAGSKKQEENVSSLQLPASSSSELSKQILRDVVIPEIEREVNEGKNFAPLRQMFYSMILASWYKLALKDALLNQVYSNQGKTGGVLSDDPAVKEKIYEQYLVAYKKGVFNYIKEDADAVSDQVVPHKYFSGGLQLGIDKAMSIAQKYDSSMDVAMSVGGRLALLVLAVTILTGEVSLASAQKPVSMGIEIPIDGPKQKPAYSIYFANDNLDVKTSYPSASSVPRHFKINFKTGDVVDETVSPFPVVTNKTNSKEGRQIGERVKTALREAQERSPEHKDALESLIEEVDSLFDFAMADKAVVERVYKLIQEIPDKARLKISIAGHVPDQVTANKATDILGEILRQLEDVAPDTLGNIKQMSQEYMPIINAWAKIAKVWAPIGFRYGYTTYPFPAQAIAQKVLNKLSDAAMSDWTTRVSEEKDRLKRIISSPNRGAGNDAEVAQAVKDWARFGDSLFAYEQKDRTALFLAVINDDQYGPLAKKAALENIELHGYTDHEYRPGGPRERMLTDISAAIKKARWHRDTGIRGAAIGAAERFGLDLAMKATINNVAVYNDGKAALLGEQSPTGQLFRNGKKIAGMAFIFGTGNNGTAGDEKGNTVTDGGAIMELGHNILRRVTGEWVFTGKKTKGGQPFKSDEESSFEDNFSGPNIAKRLARNLRAKDIVSPYIDAYPEGISDIEGMLALVLEDISIADKEKKERQKNAVDMLLKAVTKAVEAELKAQVTGKGAVKFVSDLGIEIGQALSALLFEYHGQSWVENFILVSGVGEKFARVDGFDSEADVLVGAIRKGLAEGLKRRRKSASVLSDDRVNVITSGVRRSTMSWEREALAATFTVDELKLLGDAEAYSLGYSVGGTKIGVALIGRDGKIVSHLEEEWTGRYAPEAASFVTGMINIGKRVAQGVGVDSKKIVKIGVAFAGPVNEETGVVGDRFAPPNLPFLEKINLGEELKASWDKDAVTVSGIKSFDIARKAARETIFGERRSGLLLHVTSLPSKFGIGNLGPGAYRFVDYLVKTGQSVWQVLPIGPTSPGDNSPYSSPSAFAGNELLISPELLLQAGWIAQAELDSAPVFPEGRIENDRPVREFNRKILNAAYAGFKKDAVVQDEFNAFVGRESAWLNNYALYSVIKNVSQGGKPWYEWDTEYKFHDQDTLDAIAHAYREEITQIKFVQFVFDRQMRELKAYANSRGVKLYGDMPIYVGKDSADAWGNTKLFKFDRDLNQLGRAGVPPDQFSATGQLWGNPVYNWPVHQEENFKWWVARLKRTFDLFDYVRVDHFRGLVQFWEVPLGAETAMGGEWKDVPTREFLAALKNAFPEFNGRLPVIAENLGVITPDVTEIMTEGGLPGMAVLQFADPKDNHHQYLPSNYAVNDVAYVGTHDNKTTAFWWEADLSEDQREAFLQRTREMDIDTTGMPIGLQANALTMNSNAALTIARVQDVLNLGKEGMENVPGVAAGNWGFRLKAGQLESGTAAADNLLKLTIATGRAVGSHDKAMAGKTGKAELLFEKQVALARNLLKEIGISEDEMSWVLKEKAGKITLVLSNHENITDSVLERLQNLTLLERLELNWCDVTDVGLGYLKNLSRLKVLKLSDTKITNAGLVSLQSLKQLRLLGLNSTRVTNEALEYLKDLTNLEELYLGGTEATDEAVLKFLERYFEQQKLFVISPKGEHIMWNGGAEDVVDSLGGDNAMGTINRQKRMDDPGGIDLNAKNMGLDVSSDGKGIEMNFDPAMIEEFRNGNFTGVEGIILRIVPIQSPLSILGLEASPGEGQLVKG